MGVFANLTTDNLADTGDTLGGGYEPLPSDVYPATIKLAYLGKAKASNAQSVTVHADCNGKEVRETIWITNRNGENFYPDKQDPSKKFPLPGFTTIDDLCLLSTGQPLAEMDVEEKVVKLYSYEEKKEVPTPVQVITPLLGKQVQLGVLRQIVDKTKKNEATGKYEPTGETRTENTIDKVFHAESGRTVHEFRSEIPQAEFLPLWKEKNAGKDRNKAKGLSAGGAGAGASGAGRPSAGKKLFG